MEHFQLTIPLNSPENLKKYAEIDPSFPVRVMENFEAESLHRRAREIRLDRRVYILNFIRLVLAFLGGLCVLGVGCYFMLQGYATQGASIICMVVVSFAGILLGRNIKSKGNKD